jgi:hypothetical protein
MWWYAKEGERFGPIDESELRSKLVSAEVQPTDLVWQEGMDDWKPAMEVFPATPDEAPSEAPGLPGRNLLPPPQFLRRLRKLQRSPMKNPRLSRWG